MQPVLICLAICRQRTSPALREIFWPMPSPVPVMPVPVLVPVMPVVAPVVPRPATGGRGGPDMRVEWECLAGPAVQSTAQWQEGEESAVIPRDAPPPLERPARLCPALDATLQPAGPCRPPHLHRHSSGGSPLPSYTSSPGSRSWLWLVRCGLELTRRGEMGCSKQAGGRLNNLGRVTLMQRQLPTGQLPPQRPMGRRQRMGHTSQNSLRFSTTGPLRTTCGPRRLR